jgi:hypothetical protein
MSEKSNDDMLKTFGVSYEQEVKPPTVEDYHPDLEDGPEEKVNQPPHKNIYVSGGASAAICGVLAFFGWAVFSQAFGGSPPPKKQEVEAVKEISPEEEEKKTNERLLASQAINDQSKYVLTPAQSPKSDLKPNTFKQLSSSPSPSRPRSSSPRQISYRVPRSKPAQIQGSVSSNDPQANWQALATSGSFGGPIAAIAQAQESPQSKPSAVPVDYREEQKILSGQASKSLAVGSSTLATVVDPIIKEQGTANNNGQNQQNDGQRFIIQLDGPLGSAPSGSQISVTVGTISPNGVIPLVPVSIIIDGRDNPIPEGSISVRAADGNFLLAHDISDKGKQFAGQDIGQAVFSGLGTAATLLNRPQTQSTVSGAGGFNQTTNNGQPDSAAGFAQGAFTTLAQTAQARNQASQAETISRPGLYRLDQGTKVKLFVQKPIGDL